MLCPSERESIHRERERERER
eukprot:COSAG05_NODE_22455_length_265_cov_0.415663_1_plen_20_part_10